MLVPREQVGHCELVDYRDHPAAAYLHNIEVAPGMTDNQRAALEQEGVVVPAVTDGYRAEIARVLELSFWWSQLGEEPSWP